MKVTKTSPFTGNTHTLEIPCSPEQYNKWIAGEGLIQNIMPEVPAELREFLMTGITPEEWDKFIGPGEEELDYDQEIELPSDSKVFKHEREDCDYENGCSICISDDPVEAVQTVIGSIVDLLRPDPWKENESDSETTTFDPYNSIRGEVADQMRMGM